VRIAGRGTGLVAFVAVTGFAQASTVTYVPSAVDVANPERGFYSHRETDASAPETLDPASLTADRLERQRTLALRLYFLDLFRDSPLSAAFLDLVAADLGALRQAGVKGVLRFAYARPDTWPPTQPYGDATRERILGHLAQLEPVLRAGGDVIAVVQTGFIGLWGEWYYTDHFGDQGTVSAAQWAERLAVLRAVQDAMPAVRTAQVRTPQYKQTLFGTTIPLGASQAFDSSRLARTGFHNDCFLASADDFGTYVDADDRPYLAAETRYLPMGGETCNLDPPHSECGGALTELAEYHFSYLNADYHPGVLGSWESGGCMPEIRRRLGYRLELLHGVFDDSVRPGDGFAVSVDLRNVGFAAPFGPRPVQLLLRHAGTGDLHGVALSDDPRLWLPGPMHTIAHTICVPFDLPAGSYDLLLNLPDLYPGLRQRPEYSILFANDGGVRESGTGYNDLRHAIAVAPDAPARACTSGLSLVPIAALPGPSPGRIPGDDSSGIPLRLAKGAGAGGPITLSWGTSCSPGATDYAVMEGPLGQWTDALPATCSTGAATTASLTPDSGDRYFLVVALSETAEGSYGVDSTGAERPRSSAPCRPSHETACP
jgi:hypothetical protein